MSKERYARVVVDITHHDVDKYFDYRIPRELDERVREGMRVFVPFGKGNRQREALVMRILPTSDYAGELKSILGVPKHMQALPPEMIRLARWMHDTYGCTMSEAVCLMFPAALRNLGGEKTHLVASLALPPEQAREQAQHLRARAPKQARLLELLCDLEGVALKELGGFGLSAAVAHGLEKKGLVRLLPFASRRKPRRMEIEDAVVRMNEDQERAARAICEQRGYAQMLLYGVTGSGKTEVYLQAVQDCLRRGKNALVLVPEIALTQQLMGRFAARLGEDVALLHSRLSAGERLDEWQRIADGKARVVLGARSAAFAPVSNLGVIVMDEEQESGYDAGGHPRYRALEVADFRAQLSACPLVLGSATPSIETFYRARTGRTRLLELPVRVGERPMAEVERVDLRREVSRGNPSIFSRKLVDALEATLEAGDQAMLFINRRGYSAQIVCMHCGHALKCRHCDVTLTYHKGQDAACCHYCHQSYSLPKTCPRCGKQMFKFSGVGTEQVERSFKKRFPDVAFARMDVDTMQAKDAHEKTLAAFARGELRVLIGTQMIAKGLDFAGVALVGVVLAETTLLLPDFRSAERTFQLITQVAGRAGRGERPGRVLVQSFCPEHPVLEMASRQDYQAFYDFEIENRRRLQYTPFSQMVRLLVVGRDAGAVKALAAERYRQLGDAIIQAGVQPLALWAAPAPIERIRGKWRYQIVAKLRPEDLSALRPALFDLRWQEQRSDCRIDLELNPTNMV